MDCFMLSTDGYWYKIARNPFKKHACMPCMDENRYTVYLDRYIQGSDNYLYKLINEDSDSGIWMTGANGMSYYVKNRKYGGKFVERPELLDEFLCQNQEIPQPQPTQQQRPIPKFNFLNGKGSATCNENGICEVHAEKGEKVSIAKPKGWDVKTNGSKYWLDKQKN